MAMTNATPIFLDTTMLVSATSPDSPFHTVARTGLVKLARAGRRGVISTQVIREYSAPLTRPTLDGSLPPLAPVLAPMTRFRGAYLVLEDTDQVVQTLITRVQTVLVGGRQIHDATIVATLRTYGIEDLYTHTTAHFARFADIIPVQPLIAPADSSPPLWRTQAT